MNRANSRSSWISLCARLTLAAFAATLPGPAAWAQAAERVAPITASVISGSLGANLSAPSVLAPSALASMNGIVPAALPAAALAAGPRAAAAAGPVLEAEMAPLGAAAPAHLSAAAPAERADAPAVSAVETLNLAAGDAKNGSSGRNAVARYDGGGRGGSSDGGSGDGRGLPSPAQAPMLTLNKIFFPGTGTVRIAVHADYVGVVAAALRNDGYAIAVTAGKDTAKGHSSTAVLVRLSNPSAADGKQTIDMNVIRPVKIEGYGTTAETVTVVKASYPKLEPSDPTRMKELGEAAQSITEHFASLDPQISKALVGRVTVEDSGERVANVLAQYMPFSDQIKLAMLAAPSLEARLRMVIMEMTAHFKAKSAKAAEGADGASSAKPLESVEALTAKMKAIGMPQEIQEVMLKEYDAYSMMSPKDSEAQKIRNYLEWLLAMPWGQRTEDSRDLAKARVVLDQDHTGLDLVKTRVLEFLALRAKTGSKKGAILAFTGPAGVGKTTIAAAIAEALGRKFVRLSLGGVHDESVIRGHGRTFVGSMPGEVMRMMKKAGTKNPVMLMDEIDKIGRNGPSGDPTAALLEVLDPAQNNTYRDRYLDVDYDLSEVLFVVTANEIDKIPDALRNRLEVIDFDGYTTLEKIEIARTKIVPKKLEAAGLTAAEITLTPGAIRRIIEGYAMNEAGVRTLEAKIEAVLRKISTWPAMHGGEKAPAVVDEKDVAAYLGVAPFSPRQTAQNGVGVATGLAVNSLGGSTLNVEVSYKIGGTGKLTLRHQFGKAIDDSAHNALEYVRLNADKFGLEKLNFMKVDVDMNLTPSGDVDGPSAGGLMATAIISSLTGRAVAPGLAMTGEITKRGDILPIGGLKQKVMAAHRMGYREVIFPAANLKDVENIPKEVRDGIILKAATTYDDIYGDALVTEVTGKPANTSLGARFIAALRALNPLSSRASR